MDSSHIKVYKFTSAQSTTKQRLIPYYLIQPQNFRLKTNVVWAYCGEACGSYHYLVIAKAIVNHMMLTLSLNGCLHQAVGEALCYKKYNCEVKQMGINKNDTWGKYVWRNSEIIERNNSVRNIKSYKKH